MALKNPQTTKQYDTTQTTKANNTKVAAKEYDTTQTTKKPSMKVKATVEGSK